MYTLLLFLAFSSSSAPADTAQNLLITYDFTFQEFESKPTSFISTEALLFITDTASYYIDRAKYTNDTLRRSSHYKSLSVEEKMVKYYSAEKSKFRYIINKNYNSRIVAYTDVIHKAYFIYEEDFPEINWQITADTTRILNYLCQRAIGDFAGRSYEAWFSNDIPVSDGPYKFTGLPGLIMKLKDTEEQFTFNIKGIEVRKNLKIPPYSRKNVITKDNFKKRMDDYYANMINYRRDEVGRRNIVSNGKPESLEDFFKELNKEYLDEVRIEKE